MKLRVLIAIATIVPLVSVGVVFVPMRANERWDAMTQWADRAEAAWDSRDFRRATATGAAADGNAFVHYDKAIASSRTRSDADRALLRDLRLHPERVSAADAASFETRWGETIARMRDGARSGEAMPRITWRHGFAVQPTELLPARDVANATVVVARRLRDQGKVQEALEVGLDAAQFAIDMQQSPVVIDQMIATALSTIVCSELFDEAFLVSLDATQKATAERAFAQLESQCLHGFRGEGDVLLLAHSLKRSAADALPELESEVPEAELTTWRYGWSKRWAMADGVMLLVDICSQLENGVDLSWTLRQELVEAQCQRIRVSANPALGAWDGTIVGFERSARIALSHVRLLRAALRLSLGESVESIQDPLGDGPFAVVRDGASVRVSSNGGTKLHPLSRTAQVR